MATETITLTPSQPWPADERLNMAWAMLIGLLADNGITHGQTRQTGRPLAGTTDPLVFEVDDPSQPVSALTLGMLNTKYRAWKTADDAQKAAEAQDAADEDTHAGANLPSMAQIATMIDGLQNLNDVKTFLKRLVAHLRKTGALRKD